MGSVIPATLACMSSLPIVALANLSDDSAAAIRAIDPRIDLRRLQPGTLRWLRSRGDWAQDNPSDPADALADFRAAADGAEIWFSGYYPHIRLPDQGSLRWIQVWSAGTDWLLERGVPDQITVTSAAGLHRAAISEWVFAYILSHEKGLLRAFRQQQDAVWQRWIPGVLQGRTLGIVGLGAIGAGVAQLGRAFGMRVVATKRSARPGDHAQHCDALYPPSGLPTLLGESDYVVLAIPLTNDTRGLIGRAALDAMRPTTALINIARGPIVNWQAVRDALADRRLAAYYTDVTVPEPLPDGDPAWSDPNLFITPHVSGAFDGYLEGATELFIDNLRRYVAGEPLRNVVDRERGY